MKFGIFYEHQLPRPWEPGSELQLFQDALDQVELADGLGIDYAWEVEHHFLEEYSHSSAPEVFLAACSQRTRRIRLGHGIVLMPPGYNQPARVAERLATLDLGFRGQFFSMPARNVVPKPVQKPHPPIWVACSNRETIHLAAQLGIGALTFAFIDPAEAKTWVDDYYETFKRECVPIGHAVNPNIAMVTGFSCHGSAEEARRRGSDGFRFFQFALGHHYVFGKHKPGRTNIWTAFEAVRDQIGTEVLGGGANCIGTPEELRAALRTFQDAGVDQTIFIQQGGKNRHDHICESLELFAAKVMPEFAEREAERERVKREELAPYVEAAMARKQVMAPLAEGDIPVHEAYGNTVALTDEDIQKLPEGNRLRVLTFRRIREIAERAAKGK